MTQKETKTTFQFSEIPAGSCRFYSSKDLIKIQNWQAIWRREWRNAKRKNTMLVDAGGVGGIRIMNKKSPEF